MKRILCLILAVTMLVGTLGILTSCGEKDAEIRIYLGDQIYDFDPALAFVDDNVSRVMSLIYEPLFVMDEDGDIDYGLAEDYEIIEDEERGIYQMEITLKETYWNDGKTQVTADDVYFAWTRILDPGFACQAAPLLYDIKNAKAVKQDSYGEEAETLGQIVSRNDLGLEANKDRLTITFEGKIDYDAFLRNLTSIALVPLRENKVTEGDPGESYWAKRTSYIATNGPFSIRNWSKSTGEFTLQRNEYYHVSEPEEGEKTDEVYPSRLQMQWTNENFGSDYGADMNAFLLEKLDKFGLEAIAEEAIFCVGQLPMDREVREKYLEDMIVYDAFSTYSFIFNTERELFQDENVRKALSMVIDREYIAKELVYAEAADGLISNAVWNAGDKDVTFRSEAESLIVTTARMDEARELLRGVNTNQLITLTVRDTPEEVFIANHVSEQWSELGFNVLVTTVTVDTKVWSDKPYEGGGRIVEVGSQVRVYDDGIQAAYASGQFDVLGLDYQMYSTNALTALCGFTTKLNGNGVNYYFDESGTSITESRLHCSGFSDAAYDAIIDRALAEPDLEKRAVILHEAEAYLISKMPIVPIVYNQNYYLVEGIGGLEFDGYGNPVFTEATLE